ncbi:MAG TPA: aminoglycoside 6-adenylyltransferase [Longilinea sp.]|nr:aminoglycoside 6-adenylyltransferase [Longilinea sp.]
MRTSSEILELLLSTAREDERIRAVIMNGSRLNPNIKPDPFQDFDIVYVVSDVNSFTSDPYWIDRFGERMVMQTPDAMEGEPENSLGSFAYLLQFQDGNRIDLTLFPLANLASLPPDSLSKTLLDKDGLLPPFPEPDESSYFPKPPTARQFTECCNEFWWVTPYAAKGLWRAQLPYAHHMLDVILRDQLMKMLVWYAGVRTGFQKNIGGYEKFLQRYIDPELWQKLERTYAGADPEQTWQALFTMGELFRITASTVAVHFGYPYPSQEDERVTAYLHTIHTLPRHTASLY